ncbi:acyloxyacyl hydrolase [Prosthecochloris sp. ZM_2]|nr:acyloxyacyl hydrolase [Prosthecochloris sp. ZM_2]
MSFNFRCRAMSHFFLLCVLLVSMVLPSGACLAEAQGEEPSVVFSEIGFGGGYVAGELRASGEDFHVIPFYLRAGYDISRLVGLSGESSSLQLSFDPFVNYIDARDSGVEAGLTVFFRYFVPVSRGLQLFAEVGSGPMYLSVETDEQGEAGFNFLSQFGLGGRTMLSRRVAFDLSYRYRHLSHGGLRDSPNLGLDTFGLFGGLSLLF